MHDEQHTSHTHMSHRRATVTRWQLPPPTHQADGVPHVSGADGGRCVVGLLLDRLGNGTQLLLHLLDGANLQHTHTGSSRQAAASAQLLATS
jgi:hypothetical protein